MPDLCPDSLNVERRNLTALDLLDTDCHLPSQLPQMVTAHIFRLAQTAIQLPPLIRRETSCGFKHFRNCTHARIIAREFCCATVISSHSRSWWVITTSAVGSFPVV